MLGAGLIFFLAVLQGASELFPVSSLGHAVVAPPLLHLGFHESDPAFVPVLTMLHLGTAAARASQHAAGDPAYARVEGLHWRTALLVGVCQVAALFPGISRSGVTMAAGLLAGLRHQEAARFSFLLATPIILGAGLLEVPDLGPDRPTALLAAGAAAVAGIIAYVSARFLVRYLRFGRLDPFAYYCAALGIATLIALR